GQAFLGALRLPRKAKPARDDKRGKKTAFPPRPRSQSCRGIKAAPIALTGTGPRLSLSFKGGPWEMPMTARFAFVAAACVLTGAAAGSHSATAHYMTVALPDGGLARIAYVSARPVDMDDAFDPDEGLSGATLYALPDNRPDNLFVNQAPGSATGDACIQETIVT